MYYVYILTNWSNKVLYTGVTNNLERRFYEHRNKLVPGFTEKYNVNKLVYCDSTIDVKAAIAAVGSRKAFELAVKWVYSLITPSLCPIRTIITI
jgi:predicted GIY-YIG superfamily endonuclease